MTKPTIAIIIPNYNCLNFLPTCFLSIQQQDYADYQVIVVDDGSTDGSIEYIQEVQKTWPQLVLLQQQRQGPGAARNLAAQYTQAPLLAFLDADDWWAPGKLAAQVNFHLNHLDVGLSFTDYQHIEEQHKTEVIRCFDYWPEFSRYLHATRPRQLFERLPNGHAILIAENVVGTSSVVVQRSVFMAVHGFDTGLPSASDWDLWLKISKISAVGFSRECFMYYLQRAGSVSSNYSKRFNAVDTILNRYLPDIQQCCPEYVKAAERAREVARHEMYAGSGHYLQAFQSAMKSFLMQPHARHIKTAVKDLYAAVHRR